MKYGPKSNCGQADGIHHICDEVVKFAVDETRWDELCAICVPKNVQLCSAELCVLAFSSLLLCTILNALPDSMRCQMLCLTLHGVKCSA